jgi:hypothetical protein
MFTRCIFSALSASALILALFLACGAREARAAIGNAVQRGNVVYVYDEKGRQIFDKPSGSGKGDGLAGYTSGTVSIKRGSVVYTYDEKGRQLFAKPTGK